jgi:solute:Na+ symporter, SSS family
MTALIFNSCATVVTMDLYRKIAPNASEHRLLRVGQLTTLGMVVLSLLWIPFISVISSGLFIYIQSVQSYIGPPIAAAFLVGVLWSLYNAKGAMAALIIGVMVGSARLILEMNKRALSGVWVEEFVNINFLSGRSGGILAK